VPETNHKPDSSVLPSEQEIVNRMTQYGTQYLEAQKVK
jgi:hypothetical protein